MTRARPFRFGVFGENARTGAVLVDTVRRAEDAGYSTFLIRDHFIEEPFGHQLAPLTALATVAAATTRLRVGSLVLSNDYRHPVTLAKEIATLDVLSNGRVELGLGAGFSKAEYDGAGIPFDPPGVRVDRLEEAIHVVKGLFGDKPLTFAGKHYAITNLDGYPKPVQRPHPPILVGALARRRFVESQGHTDVASVDAWLRLAFPLYTRTPRDPDVARRAVRRPEVTQWFTRPGGEGHTFNLFPDLSRVRCSTLVVGGEDNPMTPIECQADIAAALPAHLVRFERFPGCGHAVLPDAPERALAVIRDFIAR